MTDRRLSLVPGAVLAAVVAAALVAAALVVTSAGAGGRARASASAWTRDGSEGLVEARGNETARGDGTYAASSTTGRRGSARARARVGSVSVFDGLVSARSVVVSASAGGGAGASGGQASALRAGGRAYGSPTSPRSFAIPGGYGRVSVLRGGPSGITGLTVELTRAYRGNPAGSVSRIAYAAARAHDGARPRRRNRSARRTDSTSQGTGPRQPRSSGGSQASSGLDAGREIGGGKRRKAPNVVAELTGRRYTFPVFGNSSYSDEFGAPRGSDSKHEGNDVFADYGTPVVAVTSGTLNRVGTKKISGNRLWLKSKQGHSFFYAHLAAFARDARSGAAVKAGQVLGFVGSTGDAEQTPPHVHFEVHPNDGKAVNPYPFLRAWESGRDVPAGAWLARYGSDPSARPGALVELRDYLER